jgi:hypothetical protein
MVQLLAALKDDKKTDTTPQRKKYKTAGNYKEQPNQTEDEMDADAIEDHIPEHPYPRTKYIRPPQDFHRNARGDETNDKVTNPEEGQEHK